MYLRWQGEFTFPGGAVDGGESIEAAARREVGEELGVAVPADARLRLLSVKQTRPINNTSNIMYNFVAVAEENAWLRAFDVEAANGRLARQRADLQQLLWPNDDDEDGASGGDGSGGAGRFWGLPLSERAVLAPEVQRVGECDHHRDNHSANSQNREALGSNARWVALTCGAVAHGRPGRTAEWLDVCTAVRLSFTSMNPEPYTPVNDYQREEFRRHHRKRRDPMFRASSRPAWPTPRLSLSCRAATATAAAS
jgi:ADP-ribose pyrophosphatase YjhB (NUDIX family)